MISVRRNPEMLWNVLLCAAIAVIAVSSWFLFVKAPSAESKTSPAALDQLARTGLTVQKAKDAAAAARAEVAAERWDLDPETLGSTVLDFLTQMVDKRGLQLSGFRTEKPVSVGHLREAPFVATVEGSYSDLIKLLNNLEDPKAKLTLNMLEVTASDHGSGQVIATLGLVALIPEAKA